MVFIVKQCGAARPAGFLLSCKNPWYHYSLYVAPDSQCCCRIQPVTTPNPLSASWHKGENTQQELVIFCSNYVLTVSSQDPMFLEMKQEKMQATCLVEELFSLKLT